MDDNPEKQHDNARHEFGNTDAGVVGRTLEALHSVADPSKSQKQSTHRFNWREWRAWANFSVAVLTLAAVIWYAAIARHQWREMIRSNNQMISQNKLTEQALLETRRSNELTQRAWVLARRLDLVRDPLTQKWGVIAALDNGGHTPATIQTFGIGAIVYPRDHVTPCIDITFLVADMTYLIVPQKESSLTWYRGHKGESEIDPAIVLALRYRASHHLTVQGAIQYTDPFKKPRRSTFCFVLAPEVGPANAVAFTKPGPRPQDAAFTQCGTCSSWD